MAETLAGVTDSLDVDLNRLQETVKDRTAWHTGDRRVTKSRHSFALNDDDSGPEHRTQKKTYRRWPSDF